MPTARIKNLDPGMLMGVIVASGTLTVCSGMASITLRFNNYDCRCSTELGCVDCWVSRSLAGEFFVYPHLIEAHDLAAADLDHRHARLPRLADDVASSIRFAFYVDLLERNPALFEITLRPATPRTRRLAEQ